MAKSKYEYVREYEESDLMIRDCWIVIRIDGSNFHRFSEQHNFQKPNDERALRLANRAAVAVMQDRLSAAEKWKILILDNLKQGFADCVFAYGQSDEFS